MTMTSAVAGGGAAVAGATEIGDAVATPALDFDATTRAEPTELADVFRAELSPLWSTNRGVHGGSLVAVAVQAIEVAHPDRRVRTVATGFSRTAAPGPAWVTLDVVDASRSLTTVVATLRQAERAVMTTRATLVEDLDGPSWSRPVHRLEVPLSECVPIEPPDPRPPHFDRADGLLDPSSLPFSGQPDAIVRGYLRPKEDRPIDAAWLAMASDWFPPPAFVRLDPPSGGISIDLVTHVHRTLPALGGGWLTASFEVECSHDGLAVEHGRIATPEGELVAESFHTRWTAGGTDTTSRS
jgi:acyl-CoA thioesterase